MRIFESILLVLVAAALVSAFPFRRIRPRQTLGICAVGALVAVVQAAFEGIRWQILPAHVLLVLVALGALLGLKRSAAEPLKRRRWPRILAVVVGLIVLGSSGALAYLLPVFQFEPPTGPYAVGVSTFEWTDAARPEVLSHDPNARRKILARIWYPAAPAAGAKPVPYLEPRVASGVARGLKLPGFALGHLALVSTSSFSDAPLVQSDEPFPVLLYSHGLGTYVNQSVFQVEELASHGYVVVGIQHTYDAAFTSFHDGSAVPFESPGDTRRPTESEKFLAPRLDVWVEDARFVLTRLASLQDDDPRFARRLDLSRVGYLGHSFGGAAAMATLAKDPRFRAGLNMDGGHFGASADARPSQPFMLMTGQSLEVKDEDLARTGMTRAEFDAFANDLKQRWERAMTPAPGPRYRVEIQGVSHLGFSDLSQMAPALLAGAMPPRHAHRIVNEYALAFFDAYLKGKPSPLLRDPAVDPAVKFTAFAGPGG